MKRILFLIIGLILIIMSISCVPPVIPLADEAIKARVISISVDGRFVELGFENNLQKVFPAENRWTFATVGKYDFQNLIINKEYFFYLYEGRLIVGYREVR